jgi:ribosomal protein S30
MAPHGENREMRAAPREAPLLHCCVIGRCEAPLGAACYAGLVRQHRPKRLAEFRCRLGCHRVRNTRSLYDARVSAAQGRSACPSPGLNLKAGASRRFSPKLFDEKTAALSPLRLPAVDKPPTIAYGLRGLPPFVHDGRALHALLAEGRAGRPGSSRRGRPLQNCCARCLRPAGISSAGARACSLMKPEKST